ncbi:hypothetical protein [Mesoterricola silvestris]|uniref:hypothetical protein n=1 Tax=Mesoterricola silvestris TaxID=2927979 RepID=UPI00292D4B09|nr:hypothetical protein [Mesoterricola silvestris]
MDTTLERSPKSGSESESVPGERYFDVRMAHVKCLGLMGTLKIDVVSIGNGHQGKAKVEQMRSSPEYHSFS